MPAQPSGSAIRRMRATVSEILEDGSEVKLTLSAPGFIVRLAHVEGQKPSDTKRAFARFCKANGIIATPCEWSAGVYSSRTGKEIPRNDSAKYVEREWDGTRFYDQDISAYRVMGEGEALSLLFDHPTIGEYHASLAVRVPVIAGGNGEERPRPSSGSAFGKPNTVSTTATQLAKQQSERIRSDRKAWGATTAQ